MISVKFTGLIDMQLLKKFNDSVLERNLFWEQNSREGFLTGQQLFDGLQQRYAGLSDDQF
jgi:hypothetical protein